MKENMKIADNCEVEVEDDQVQAGKQRLKRPLILKIYILSTDIYNVNSFCAFFIDNEPAFLREGLPIRFVYVLRGYISANLTNIEPI